MHLALGVDVVVTLVSAALISLALSPRSAPRAGRTEHEGDRHD